MRVILPICLVCLLLSPALAQVGAQASDLSQPYRITLGQMYALSMPQIFAALMKDAGWDAPVLAAYDAESKLIRVDILGSRTNIDDAKGSVEDFRSKILAPSLLYLNKALDKKLDEALVRILYTNRQSGKTLLVFEKGTYTLR